jgi:IS1 family transposase
MGIDSCVEIVKKAKRAVGRMKEFFSDANSCYEITFKKYFKRGKLTVTKAQTHLIDSSNSSIRDNLARFSRRTKRYGKRLEMLIKTLYLFFNRTKLGNMFEFAMCP